MLLVIAVIFGAVWAWSLNAPFLVNKLWAHLMLAPAIICLVSHFMGQKKQIRHPRMEPRGQRKQSSILRD